MDTRTKLENNNQKIVSVNTGLSSIKDKLTSKGLNYVELQSKTVTPSTEEQIITPDDGKYLSKVTVNPIPSGGLTLNSISALPTANKYNVGCYANVGGTNYVCNKNGNGTSLQNNAETLIGKTIKLDIGSLTADGKLYTGGEYTASREVYIDLVNASGSTYDAIRIQLKLKTVNGVNQIEEIYYLYYPGNTGYRYYWYCYGKTSVDDTTTSKYFDNNTITFTTDNVQILSDYGYIKSSSQSNEWLKYLTIGETTYEWVTVD